MKRPKLKRSKLRAHVRQMASELEMKSYEHWGAQEFPIVFQRVVDDEEIQVQIDLLENTDEYLHLLVAISGSFFSQFFPVSRSFMVYKSE